MRVLTVSHLHLSRMKCQIFGGPLQQVQWTNMKVLPPRSSLLPSNIWNQEKLQAQILLYLPGANNPCWSCTEVLVVWLPFSCLRHLKILKVWRRALVVVISKPTKPVEHLKSYCPTSCFVPPTKSLKGSYMLVLSWLLTHFSLGSRLGSDEEGQPWIRLFCLLKTTRIHLRPRKRLVPCLSIW